MGSAPLPIPPLPKSTPPGGERGGAGAIFTLILVKNCLKQARGSTFRLLASSRMNCMTMVWWATCSIRARFWGEKGKKKGA